MKHAKLSFISLFRFTIQKEKLGLFQNKLYKSLKLNANFIFDLHNNIHRTNNHKHYPVN